MTRKERTYEVVARAYDTRIYEVTAMSAKQASERFLNGEADHICCLGGEFGDPRVLSVRWVKSSAGTEGDR